MEEHKLSYADLVNCIKMMSEAKTQVRNGMDVDYVYGKYIICFDMECFKHYKGGKTHGLVSHAICHMREFDEKKATYIVNQAISDIKSKFVDKLIVLDNTRKVIAKGRSATKYLSFATIMNYFDYINDSVRKSGGQLTDTDQHFRKYISMLTTQYATFITDMVNNAISVDNLDKDTFEKIVPNSKYIKFDGKNNRGTTKTVIMSLRKKWLMYFNKGRVDTLMSVTNANGSPISPLKKLKLQNFKAIDPNVRRLISSAK